MVIRRFPWRLPRPDKDQSFKNFVQPGNEGAERLFKLLPRYMRPVISHILITDPEKRYTLEEVLANEWVKSISICTPDRPARGHPHHLLVEPSRQVQQGRNLIVLPPSKEEEEKKKKKPAK